MKGKIFSPLAALVILAIFVPVVSAGPPDPPTLSGSVEAAMAAFDEKSTDMFATAGTAFLVLDKEQDVVTRFDGQAYSAWKPGGDLYFVTCSGQTCLAGGWNVLWTSHDGGATWDPANLTNEKDPQGLWVTYRVKLEGGFSDADFDLDGKTIAVSVANALDNTGGVYWSSDSGLTWYPGPKGLDGGPITRLERVNGELVVVNGVDAYKLVHHYRYPGASEPAYSSWEQMQLGLAGGGSCHYVPDYALWACSDRASSYDSFVLAPDVLGDEKVYVPSWHRVSEKGDCLITGAHGDMVSTDRCGVCRIRRIAKQWDSLARAYVEDRAKTNWSDWICTEFARSADQPPIEIRFIDGVDGYPLAATSRGLKWVVQ